MQTAPREISLSFTEELQPAFSTVRVLDGNGARVDQGKARISAGTMHVGQALPPGTYKIHGTRSRWIRHDRGDFQLSGRAPRNR